MGKHGRRKSDQPVRPYVAVSDGDDPQKTAANMDHLHSLHTVRAADKRLQGQDPYQNEPGSKGPVRNGKRLPR